MPMTDELFLAILAMDSYNRDYGAGVEGLDANEGEKIGQATIVKLVEPTEPKDGISGTPKDAGFYGIAYDWNGKTVISYRGTDNFADSDVVGGSDITEGWVSGLGVVSRQVDWALQFYKDVTGKSVFDGKADNVILTGHSLGGGLAGIVSGLSGVNRDE